VEKFSISIVPLLLRIISIYNIAKLNESEKLLNEIITIINITKKLINLLYLIIESLLFIPYKLYIIDTKKLKNKNKYISPLFILFILKIKQYILYIDPTKKKIYLRIIFIF